MTGHQLPRRFALYRWWDPSGVSGTGLVAFGTAYPSGRTTVAWCAGDIASVTVYDAPDQVLQVHGHAGLTRLLWLDGPGGYRPVPVVSGDGSGGELGDVAA